MSKLGMTAVLLSAMWLTLAAFHSTPNTDAEQDELQGMETEHLQKAADPSAWGQILEQQAALRGE